MSLRLPRPPIFDEVRGLSEHFLRLQNEIEQWSTRVWTKRADVDHPHSLNIQGDLTLSTTTPSSASDTGVAGTITWDASYIYVCTATDTWKRVAISTW